MLNLIVSSQSIDQQPSELIAVGFFEDECPPRSNAGLIDERMGGIVSRRMTQGFMTGRLGEKTLIPANGKVRADKILFIGLGQTKTFCYGRIRDLTEHLVGTCLGLQICDLAMALPDLQEFGLDWDKLIESIVEGIGLGLEATDPAYELRLRLPGGLEYHDQIIRGVETTARILKNPVPVRVYLEPSS
jgi:hypothetical protein